MESQQSSSTRTEQDCPWEGPQGEESSFWGLQTPGTAVTPLEQLQGHNWEFWDNSIPKVIPSSYKAQDTILFSVSLCDWHQFSNPKPGFSSRIKSLCLAAGSLEPSCTNSQIKATPVQVKQNKKQQFKSMQGSINPRVSFEPQLSAAHHNVN